MMWGDEDLPEIAVIAAPSSSDESAILSCLAWGIDEVVPPAYPGMFVDLLAALRHPQRDRRRRSPDKGKVVTNCAAPTTLAALCRGLERGRYQALPCADAEALEEALLHPSTEAAVLYAPDRARAEQLLQGIGLRETPLGSLVLLVPPEDVGLITAEHRTDPTLRILAQSSPPDVILEAMMEFRGTAEQTARPNPRIRHLAPASFRIDEDSAEIHGLLTEVRVNGVVIRTAMPPEEGRVVRVVMKAPGLPKPLRFHAEVVRSVPYARCSPGLTAPGFAARINRSDEEAYANWLKLYRKMVWSHFSRCETHPKQAAEAPSAKAPPAPRPGSPRFTESRPNPQPQARRPALPQRAANDTTANDTLSAMRRIEAARERVRRRQKGEDWVGTVLDGRFEILEKIGEGGMGWVYRARQLSMERDVVVKVLRRSLTESQDAAERFTNEARATSQLRSEHTIMVFDFGEAPDGRRYLVMELLEGITLSKRLMAGPLTLEESARTLLQICDSLGEAHAKGVVHRDLKPQNIYMERLHRGRVRVKVLDFGIAKLVALDGKRSHLTPEGMVMGTPHYVPPEQLKDP